jgi:hypothetical protein
MSPAPPLLILVRARRGNSERQLRDESGAVICRCIETHHDIIHSLIHSEIHSDIHSPPCGFVEKCAGSVSNLTAPLVAELNGAQLPRRLRSGLPREARAEFRAKKSIRKPIQCDDAATKQATLMEYPGGLSLRWCFT